MKAIINKGENFGTLDGVIKSNYEIRTLINHHLKAGTAKKIVDTENTLMYDLSCNHDATTIIGNNFECMKCGLKVKLEENKTSNLHPIFEQALKPFGIK